MTDNKNSHYGALTRTKRKHGGKILQNKKVLKHHLKTADVGVGEKGQNRARWRKQIVDAVFLFLLLSLDVHIALYVALRGYCTPGPYF